MANEITLPIAQDSTISDPIAFRINLRLSTVNLPVGPGHVPRPTELMLNLPNSAIGGECDDSGGAGLAGASTSGYGIWGYSQSNQYPGVYGENGTLAGVIGIGKNGVHGRSNSANDSGVWGENTARGYGVSGSTNSDFQPGPQVRAGVWGDNAGAGAGVKGTSNGGDGVLGHTVAKGHAGVSAVNEGGGFGLWASGAPAGHFEGDVEVTGTVFSHDVVLSNQDCAEDFDIAPSTNIDPGTVVVLNERGLLQESQRAYDKKVAGVISGAGMFKPGLILGRELNSRDRLRIPAKANGFPKGSRTAFRAEGEHHRSVATLAF